MKIFNRLGLAMICGAVLAFAGPAHALTFNFSFDGGAVTGEIDGLYANGTNEMATHVIIDTAPALGFGFTPPYDTMNDTVNDNSFDVNASGQITSFFYNAYAQSLSGATYDLCFGGACDYNGNTPFSVFLAANGLGGGAVTASTIDFTSATPLPATLPLFASGLGALGLLGWRRKWKKTSA